MRKVIAILSCLVASNCSANSLDGLLYKTPAAPNYSEEKNWSRFPRKIAADVDVFYIHPTTFDSFLAWNADVSDEDLNKITDVEAIKIQTSIFENSAEIYAPRYRQATLYAFDPKDEKQEALDVAYSDVKRAFEFYLKNRNHNRPLIIVSHSQGSYHAARLLQEFDLGKKLIVAYLIGEAIGEKTFKNLRVCESATQINCFVTFSSVLDGAKPILTTGRPIGKKVCVNPLSWKISEEEISAEKNLGGMPESFDRIDKEIVSAKCKNGILHINKPNKNGYPSYDDDYHLSDFNLFYMNLRENSKDRIRAFWQH